jgi:flagellar hook protein FlgE
MSVSTIAMTAMAHANQRLEASAERVARSGEVGSDVDIGAEMIEQTKAKESFNASVMVLKAADEMVGQLLDMKS